MWPPWSCLVKCRGRVQRQSRVLKAEIDNSMLNISLLLRRYAKIFP
jgi:hypothetical protein